MWKRGGRSSALDRAQALLSAKRNSRGDAESMQGPAAKTQGNVGGSVKSNVISVPPRTHNLLSDLSDLSSVSSASEHGAVIMGSASAVNNHGRVGEPTKDLRPQSSLGGGGGSRFLKKAPPPVNNSSQSPVRKSQTQQVPEPRYESSTLRGSQTAALSRLAQIESRIRSRNQAGKGPKPAENLTSDLGISPPPAPQSLEASVQLSAQASSDQSLKGKHFLKTNTAVVVNSSNTTAAKTPKGPDVGVRPRSRAADAVVPLGVSETKSVGIVSGVSLESDEEDMRKLLGDSLDPSDNSFLISGRPSSIRTADKILSKCTQKVLSTPPPTTVPPSSSSNTDSPHSPASPSYRGSPFRFTGQAQARFSPSVLSPSPSPPCVSVHRTGSPQRSPSSMSGCSNVLSLEELFPVGPGSEDPHSEMSAVSSEDFRINVMTLDDLVPAKLGFTEEAPGQEREAKLSAHVPRPPNRQQLPKLKEKEQQQQQEEEDVLDYQSDFESESRTKPDHSVSLVSEHLQGHGDEEEVVSEVREEALDSDMSCGRTEDDYSTTFSDTSHSYTSRTSDRSQTLSRSRDSRSSRSSVSHGSRTSSHNLRRHASTRKVLKEAAVQTHLDDPLAYTRPAGMATLGAAVGKTYMDPTTVVAHTLSAEMVEALSTFNPGVFALTELLKQQLAMTRRFIESRRHLHSSLLQSLEPPNYRYTTLEDTKEYLRRHRPPKLTMEEALEEVLQDMRGCHHI